MVSTALRAQRFLRLTPRTRLLLDVLLLALFVALDVRDLWFKLRWLGPHDSYSFVGMTHLELQDAPLVPTRNLTFAGQRLQRASGWSSFLLKCESLHAITDVHRDRRHTGSNIGGDGSTAVTFAHVLGKQCALGVPENSHRVSELVMSSNARVDSVAWAACKLLQYDRKPAICHSGVVRRFAERYNMDAAPSLLAYKHHNTNASLSTDGNASAVTPGSDAEDELTDLLSVISTSSPLSAVVCVEAFVPHGPGRYATTIVGCGSPSYYRSAFAGFHAPALALYLQDKAALAADTLHIAGMTFVTRANSRSVYTLRNIIHGAFALRHTSLLNLSSFGALYTLMLALDTLLLTLKVASAAATARTVFDRSTNSQPHNYKLGVLTASLHRSHVVVALTVAAQLLTWVVILPSAAIWDATTLQTGKTHAWLTASRAWILVLLSVNAVWDACVALSERQALAFARTTHARVSEVACVAAVAAYWHRDAVFAITAAKRSLERQQLRDAVSFHGGAVAVSNAFAEHLDSVQTTPYRVLVLVYKPLGMIVVTGVVLTAVLAIVRSWYVRAVHQELLRDHHSSLAVPAKRASKFAVVPDRRSESPTKPLLMQPSSSNDDATSDPARSVQFAAASQSSLSPPSSPTRGRALAFRDVGSPAVDAHDSNRLRLPLEDVVDSPIRARSLVRSVWLMEKRAGQRVALHAALLLEHGIAMRDSSGAHMHTRVGFFGVVQPFLSLTAHAVGDGSECSRIPQQQLLQRAQRRASNVQEQVPLR